MCNCVRKCVTFPGFPQFVVILPVKRVAGDSRAKYPLPMVLRMHPHEILPLHSCQFAISRAPGQQTFPRRCLQIEVRPRTPLQIGYSRCFFVRWITVGEGVSLPRPRIQVVHGTVPQQCDRNASPARSGILYRLAIEGLRCHPPLTSSTRAPEVTPS